MRREDMPAELLELAKQHGIDIENLPAELSDEELEAVVGGKVFPGGGPGWGGWGGWGWGGWGGWARPFIARPFWGPRWWW
jgi:hypothetical protein